MEFYNLYVVPNISWAIKSRNMDWEEHLLRKRHKMSYDVLHGKLQWKTPLQGCKHGRKDKIKLII